MSQPSRPSWWGASSPQDAPSPSPASGIFRPLTPPDTPATPPLIAPEDPLQTALLAEAAERFATADYLTATYDPNVPGVPELHDAVVVPQWSKPFGEILLSQLLVIPRPASPQVLDVACGTGYPTLDIARFLGQSADVAGLDIWPAAIEFAKRKASAEWLRNVTFLTGDIGKAQLPEDHFDIITCNIGYTSFADRARSLAAMTRLTVPGGWLLLTTPLQTAFREFLDLYHRVLTELQLTACVDALVALVKGRPTIASVRSAVERTGMLIDREVADSFTLSFVNAQDFLTSPIIALGFMVGWRAIVPDLALRRLVFNEITRRLDAHANAKGGLRFEIPVLCLCARRMAR